MRQLLFISIFFISIHIEAQVDIFNLKEIETIKSDSLQKLKEIETMYFSIRKQQFERNRKNADLESILLRSHILLKNSLELQKNNARIMLELEAVLSAERTEKFWSNTVGDGLKVGIGVLATFLTIKYL